MLFIDSGGTIRHIKENAVPYSRAIIDSMGEVKYVVELNAGIVRKFEIKVGDKVASATVTRKESRRAEASARSLGITAFSPAWPWPGSGGP